MINLTQEQISALFGCDTKKIENCTIVKTTVEELARGKISISSGNEENRAFEEIYGSYHERECIVYLNTNNKTVCETIHIQSTKNEAILIERRLTRGGAIVQYDNESTIPGFYKIKIN